MDVSLLDDFIVVGLYTVVIVLYGDGVGNDAALLFVNGDGQPALVVLQVKVTTLVDLGVPDTHLAVGGAHQEQVVILG